MSDLLEKMRHGSNLPSQLTWHKWDPPKDYTLQIKARYFSFRILLISVDSKKGWSCFNNRSIMFLPCVMLSMFFPKHQYSSHSVCRQAPFPGAWVTQETLILFRSLHFLISVIWKSWSAPALIPDTLSHQCSEVWPCSLCAQHPWLLLAISDYILQQIKESQDPKSSQLLLSVLLFLNFLFSFLTTLVAGESPNFIADSCKHTVPLVGK